MNPISDLVAPLLFWSKVVNGKAKDRGKNAVDHSVVDVIIDYFGWFSESGIGCGKSVKQNPEKTNQDPEIQSGF